jgi:hypothetical protein
MNIDDLKKQSDRIAELEAELRSFKGAAKSNSETFFEALADIRRIQDELAAQRETNKQLAKLCNDQRETLRQIREAGAKCAQSHEDAREAICTHCGHIERAHSPWTNHCPAGNPDRPWLESVFTPKNDREGRSQPKVHLGTATPFCMMEGELTMFSQDVTCPECRAKMGGKA